jgi:hypothetical protein
MRAASLLHAAISSYESARTEQQVIITQSSDGYPKQYRCRHARHCATQGRSGNAGGRSE